TLSDILSSLVSRSLCDYQLPPDRPVDLAGREGLEPSKARSKAWCLTNLATAQRAQIRRLEVSSLASLVRRSILTGQPPLLKADRATSLHAGDGNCDVIDAVFRC